ncbi:MAG: hypothetical protein K0S16_44 [Moraxellaceae bacterium]|jgi:hypothetical protein|nr:hypothetical protein [Moraxellaceae bacterium]
MAENRNPSGAPQGNSRTEARLAEERARAQQDARQRAADQEARNRSSDSDIEPAGNNTQGGTKGGLADER